MTDLRITYIDGTDAKRECTIDPSHLMFQEVVALQKATGLTLKEWQKGLNDGDIICVGALTWLAARKAGHATDFATFDFDMDSIAVENLDPAGNPEPADEQTTP